MRRRWERWKSLMGRAADVLEVHLRDQTVRQVSGVVEALRRTLEDGVSRRV